MIIGFDGSRAFIKNRTGTENYSYQLLKYLAKVDTENIYKVYIRPGNSVEGEWPKSFHFIKINYPRLWTQAGLALQTFIDKLDLLFVPSHTLPLIRKPNLKTIMTVHDLGAEYLPQTHQLKQRLYLGFITKFQLKSATHLIAVSQATKKDLIKKVGIDSKKIDVIYEGVDENLEKNIKADTQRDILKQFDIEKNNYFLFVGTIQPRKNLTKLIESYHLQFGNMPTPPKLILAGNKGWLSDEIYNKVVALKLEQKVVFTGRVNDQQLSVLYQNAIAFVFPSLFEGFGLPILEAFSMNCPVICSDISSLPEVGGEAVVYVDPKNTKSIASALAKFVYIENNSFTINTKFRDNLINKGHAQLKKFSWEKCAKQTLDLFQEVAKK